MPLRVLVSRQVIRDRMDYTGHLTGKTKTSHRKAIEKLLDKLKTDLGTTITNQFAPLAARMQEIRQECKAAEERLAAKKQRTNKCKSRKG